MSQIHDVTYWILNDRASYGVRCDTCNLLGGRHPNLTAVQAWTLQHTADTTGTIGT